MKKKKHWHFYFKDPSLDQCFMWQLLLQSKKYNAKYFRLIKLVKKKFTIFNKIRSVYLTVYQLWSSTQQLKKISLIAANLSFYFT